MVREGVKLFQEGEDAEMEDDDDCCDVIEYDLFKRILTDLAPNKQSNVR